MAALERLKLTIQGQVQGVGFRPYVWRLANELKIVGSVANTSAGAVLDLQSSPDILQIFKSRISSDPPPLAKITAITEEILQIDTTQKEFKIITSTGQSEQKVLIPPDIAICKDCLKDIKDSQNPRFEYPFTNCTNCGPRFSITKTIPYDRASTVMQCFEMCSLCKQEYKNPADRRFHAQPIACPKCGPILWLITKSMKEKGDTLPTQKNSQDALAKAGKLIQDGNILAIRSLGGFQLACDAHNSQSVEILRKRKGRPHKALAVMSKDIQSAREFCEIDKCLENLLQSPAAPITLCPKLPDTDYKLSPLIAPDVNEIGLMLPYTPLHALLFKWLEDNGTKNPVLVMTSANPTNEPICLGNREALDRLDHLADAWLLHNRDILCRVDDSVAAKRDKKIVMIRRSRGYVPEPMPLTVKSPPILGTGAELKATFCVTRKDQAFLSQHIGDLTSPATLDFYEASLAHMQNLLEVTPKLIVHDLHPDFISTQFANNLANKLDIPAIALQHHAAHAAACLGENKVKEPALAICLDGSGLGVDGNIWGGEILRIDLQKNSWDRAGHFLPFPLPGGEAAVREPWRIKLALQWQTQTLPAKLNKASKNLIHILDRNLNCPLTTSCGRLFDAMSSLLELCDIITYEGQAAIRLESAAKRWLASHFMPIVTDAYHLDGLIDTNKIFAHAQLFYEKHSKEETAAWFHEVLAKTLSELASHYAIKYNLENVALTGGVMQNILLSKMLQDRLEQKSLKVLTHSFCPPGDGGIAYGQAVWGAALLNAMGHN